MRVGSLSKAFDSLGVWSLLACVKYFQKKHLKWLSWLYSIALLSPVWLYLFFSFHRHLSWNQVIVINAMEAWKRHGRLRPVPTKTHLFCFFLTCFFGIISDHATAIYVFLYHLFWIFLCSIPLPVHIPITFDDLEFSGVFLVLFSKLLAPWLIRYN